MDVSLHFCLLQSLVSWKVISQRMLLLPFLVILHHNVVAISLDEAQQLANHLQNNIKRLAVTVTDYETFKEEFTRLHNDNVVNIDNINMTEVSKNFAVDVERVLHSSMNALLKIKKKTEELEMEHDFNEDVTYTYLSNKDGHNEEIVPSYHPIYRVNLTHSFVQVPENVYRHDKIIINQAKWTVGLNQVFIDNRKSQPAVVWQYFSSETGMFRNYPGFK